MSDQFYRQIFDKHQHVEAVPSNKEITAWALQVIRLLFPEQSKQVFISINDLKAEFTRLENELVLVMNATKACQNCDNEQLARSFFSQIPDLYAILNTDIQAIFNGDPAAKSEFEVIRTYPGFFAISFYRLANSLYKHNVPLLPRILTEHAHSKTGIDIHPAAEIDEYFHIDHGTGIVIGESCIIGKHVKLYQGVTLGALSVAKNMANTKRHPTVEDHVVIYSGATILGGETVIGHNSVIGGNVWLTKSVPAHSTVFHKPEITVLNKSKV
ncbi:serine O-acetyltransferase [Mucilaginibacter frigoritolerans]|jgi:serine O-acetyltransferase|uniref:Serine acetyltransferase n=1 Tax=Mucilaginibacter frigoritolerans TaxID=652788 RepID=A0A562TVD1_9SPHI|nr:serine O-acetyltransferase EpsC [Mucilaginibacter frigoritolerans]TWI97114.1 serine O-acetyltransferase [Mucilaginibacter frigoritolerans]